MFQSNLIEYDEEEIFKISTKFYIHGSTFIPKYQTVAMLGMKKSANHKITVLFFDVKTKNVFQCIELEIGNSFNYLSYIKPLGDDNFVLYCGIGIFIKSPNSWELVNISKEDFFSKQSILLEEKIFYINKGFCYYDINTSKTWKSDLELDNIYFKYLMEYNRNIYAISGQKIYGLQLENLKVTCETLPFYEFDYEYEISNLVLIPSKNLMFVLFKRPGDLKLVFYEYPSFNFIYEGDFTDKEIDFMINWKDRFLFISISDKDFQKIYAIHIDSIDLEWIKLYKSKLEKGKIQNVFVDNFGKLYFQDKNGIFSIECSRWNHLFDIKGSLILRNEKFKTLLDIKF